MVKGPLEQGTTFSPSSGAIIPAAVKLHPADVGPAAP
jgi:hypothetical protein